MIAPNSRALPATSRRIPSQRILTPPLQTQRRSQNEATADDGLDGLNRAASSDPDADSDASDDWTRRFRKFDEGCGWVRTKILPRIVRAVLRFGIFTALTVGLLAPRYRRGENKGRALSPAQSRSAFGRCGFGAILGAIVVESLRSVLALECVELSRVGTLTAFVVDSFEEVALESIFMNFGIWAAPSLAKALKVSNALGGDIMLPSVRARLRKLQITALVLCLSYGVQECVMRWLIRQWTAQKYTTRVVQALAARHVFRAIADVAAAERLRVETAKAAQRGKAGLTLTRFIQRIIYEKKGLAGADRLRRDGVTDTAATTEAASPMPRKDLRTAVGLNGGLSPKQSNERASSSTSLDGTNRVLPFERAAQKLRSSLYLGSAFGYASTSEDCERLGKRLFKLIRSAIVQRQEEDIADPLIEEVRRKKQIRRSDLFDLILGSEGELTPESEHETDNAQYALHVHAFEDLFAASSPTLGEEDFVSALVRVFSERSFLSATIVSYGDLNSMLHNLVYAIWLVIVILFALLFWEVPLTDVLFALGTLSVAASFAFGASAQQMVTGAAFVLCTAPYDIGDRVMVSGVDTPPTVYPSYVERIGAYSTTFRSSFGETFTIANWVLATKAVFNHARSPQPWLQLPVQLSLHTPPAEIEKLDAAIRHFCRLNTDRFTDSATYFSQIDQKAGLIVMDIWVGCAISFQDFAAVYESRSKVYLFVHAYLCEANLLYVKPLQPLLQLRAAPPMIAHLTPNFPIAALPSFVTKAS